VKTKLTMKHFLVLLASLSLFAVVASAGSAREEFLKTLPADQTDPHCRTKLTDMWTQAARKPLGGDDDEVKIRVLSVPDNSRIVMVRWISAETAIAQCENTQHRLLAFFIKEDGKWAFVRLYKMGSAKGKS